MPRSIPLSVRLTAPTSDRFADRVELSNRRRKQVFVQSDHCRPDDVRSGSRQFHRGSRRDNRQGTVGTSDRQQNRADYQSRIDYWESPDRSDRRLLFAANNFLEEIDALTGKSILDFGKDGRVDLRAGLGRDPESLTLVQSTTPGRVFENL